MKQVKKVKLIFSWHLFLAYFLLITSMGEPLAGSHNEQYEKQTKIKKQKARQQNHISTKSTVLSFVSIKIIYKKFKVGCVLSLHRSPGREFQLCYYYCWKDFSIIPTGQCSWQFQIMPCFPFVWAENYCSTWHKSMYHVVHVVSWWSSPLSSCELKKRALGTLIYLS